MANTSGRRGKSAGPFLAAVGRDAATLQSQYVVTSANNTQKAGAHKKDASDRINNEKTKHPGTK